MCIFSDNIKRGTDLKLPRDLTQAGLEVRPSQLFLFLVPSLEIEVRPSPKIHNNAGFVVAFFESWIGDAFGV